MSKYFGNFTRREDVARGFEQCAAGQRYSDGPVDCVEGFPTDDEILFAVYETSIYEGSAFVIFERGGKLYEVHGGHCSCDGLEGQWQPEETSWAAIAMRPREKSAYDDKTYALVDSTDDAFAAFWQLVDGHLAREAK